MALVGGSATACAAVLGASSVEYAAEDAGDAGDTATTGDSAPDVADASGGADAGLDADPCAPDAHVLCVSFEDFSQTDRLVRSIPSGFEGGISDATSVSPPNSYYFVGSSDGGPAATLSFAYYPDADVPAIRGAFDLLVPSQSADGGATVFSIGGPTGRVGLVAARVSTGSGDRLQLTLVEASSFTDAQVDQPSADDFPLDAWLHVEILATFQGGALATAELRVGGVSKASSDAGLGQGAPNVPLGLIVSDAPVGTFGAYFDNVTFDVGP